MITNQDQKIAPNDFLEALDKLKTDKTIINIAKKITLQFNSILAVSDFLLSEFDTENISFRKGFELAYDEKNKHFIDFRDNINGIFVFQIKLGDDKFFIKKLKYPYNEKDIYDRIITLYEKNILNNQKEFLKRSNTNTTIAPLLSSRKISVTNISSLKELLDYKQYVGLRLDEKKYVIDKFFEEYVQEYLKSFGYKMEYSRNRKKTNYERNMPEIGDFLSFNNKEDAQVSLEYLDKKNLSNDDRNTFIAALIMKSNRLLNSYQMMTLNNLELNNYVKNIVNRFLKTSFKNQMNAFINQGNISENDLKNINYLISIAFSKTVPSIDLGDLLLATKNSGLSYFKNIVAELNVKIKDNDIIYTYASLGNKFPKTLIYEKLLYLCKNNIVKNKNKYLSNKYFEHVIFFNNDDKIFLHPTISKDKFKKLAIEIERKNN